MMAVPIQDLALWFNDAILLGTGLLVLRYVVATNKLVRTSQQQLESQSRPAIVVKEKGDKVELVNIGNGPAIEIEWRFEDRGTQPIFTNNPKEPIESLAYLEQQQTAHTGLDERSLVQWELHCLYRSISGARYASVSAFTDNGIFVTCFHSETF